MDAAEATRRRELGDFIRAHRARLQPAMFGLDPGARRRTPGLRREEMASLAGVSATWLAWIEQGRDVSVSASALGRLARVLRLTAAERVYLFGLGGRADPDIAEPEVSVIPEGLAAIVAAVAMPAYVLDRGWTARAWNGQAAKLLDGWLDEASSERNLLRFIFFDPAARKLISDYEVRARRLAAEFRADYSRHLAAPEMRSLVSELAEASPLFRAAWQEHAVVDREGGLRLFNSGDGVVLAYRQTTLAPAQQPELKLVVLEPLDTERQAAKTP